MKIQKKQKTIEQEKVIEKAHYRKVKTGKFKTFDVEDLNGKIEKHKEEIIDQVFVPAKTKKVSKDVLLWCVIDGDDCHEFTSEKEARAFIRGE